MGCFETSVKIGIWITLKRATTKTIFKMWTRQNTLISIASSTWNAYFIVSLSDGCLHALLIDKRKLCILVGWLMTVCYRIPNELEYMDRRMLRELHLCKI